MDGFRIDLADGQVGGKVGEGIRQDDFQAGQLLGGRLRLFGQRRLQPFGKTLKMAMGTPFFRGRDNLEELPSFIGVKPAG
jgi:hypothetical protein